MISGSPYKFDALCPGPERSGEASQVDGGYAKTGGNPLGTGYLVACITAQPTLSEGTLFRKPEPARLFFDGRKTDARNAMTPSIGRTSAFEFVKQRVKFPICFDLPSLESTRIRLITAILMIIFEIPTDFNRYLLKSNKRCRGF